MHVHRLHVSVASVKCFFSTRPDVLCLQGHKATSRAKLLHNQISVEAAAYRAKYEKVSARATAITDGKPVNCTAGCVSSGIMSFLICLN